MPKFFKVHRLMQPTFLKFLRHVKVTCDPFMANSISVRETWQELASKRVQAANPKLK